MLSILSGLNNEDKHRQLSPVHLFPTGGVIHWSALRDCVAKDNIRRAGRRPLQVGTEIATIRVRKTGPQPYLEVEAAFASQVGLGNGVPMPNWLDQAKEWIGLLLAEFSEPPVQVREMLSGMDQGTVLTYLYNRQ